MIRFLRTYSSLFICILFLLISGTVFGPLSIPVYLFFLVFWAFRKQHIHIILSMILILVMGDSLEWYLQFFKNLRIVAIMFAAMITIFDLFRRKYKFEAIMWLSLPFWIVSLIGVFRSPVAILSFSKMVSYLLLIMVVLHYIQYHIRKNPARVLADIARLTSWIFLAGLILAVIAPHVAIEGLRYRGIFGNPNGLGIYCTMIYMLLVIQWDLFPKNHKVITVTMILLIISTIISGSRTALGTIGIFTLLYFFYRGSRLKRYSFWMFFLPAGFIFLTIFRIEDIAEMLGLAKYLRVDSLREGTGRFWAWGIGIEKIKETWLIGRGFAYETWYFRSIRDFLNDHGHEGNMHNSFLTFIMNNGVIGFSFFFIFLLAVFRKMRVKKFAIPLLVTGLISAMFESWLNSSLNAFNIIFLLCVITLINYNRIKSYRKRRLA